MIWTWLPYPRARVMPPCLPEVSTASSSMSDRGDRILTEFEQNTSGRGWMHENIKVSACPDLDLIRDEAHALALQIFESCGDVVHVDGNMMETFAALGYELIDYRIL